LNNLNNTQAALAPQIKPFAWPVRVYYEDTDAAGVVYYANYLRFMERARTEWLRHLGFDQTVLVDQLGVVFVVRSVKIDYDLPGRFNDLLQVTVEGINVGGSRLELTQRVLRGTECIVQAQVVVVCVSSLTFKPLRIPAPLRSTIN
jgi:acyl-CoA thioester hydrolase